MQNHRTLLWLVRGAQVILKAPLLAMFLPLLAIVRRAAVMYDNFRSLVGSSGLVEDSFQLVLFTIATSGYQE